MALDGDDTSLTVYIQSLNPVNPAGDTAKSDGDNHLRFIKRCLDNSFPNVAGAVSASHTELSYCDGVGSQLAGINDTATLTNKTLTSPAINGGSLNNTITFNGEFSAGGATVSPTELSYLDGVSSNIQTQLTARLPLAGGTMSGDIAMGNNDIGGIKTASFNSVVTADSTVDWNDGLRQAITLSGNTTFTFTAPPGPANLILKVTQSSGGSNTVAWPATTKWVGGTDPTMTATANAVDLYMFFYDGTSYWGSALQNMS